MKAVYVYIGIGLYVLVGSVVGLIPATLAKNKGRSFAAWWAVSILLLGIFAVIPVALLRTYRCTQCAEVVNPSARLCPHCRTRLPERQVIDPLLVQRMALVAVMAVLGAVGIGFAAFTSLTAAQASLVTVGLSLALATIVAGGMAVAQQSTRH